MAGNLAIAIMAAFTGAAFYINFAEHPARMRLDAGAALTQWKPSYARGFMMQASLALLGTAAGIWAYVQSGGWLNLAGAVLAFSNWPFTLKYIMPVNKALERTQPAEAGPDTAGLLSRWARLHAVRTCLGLAATLCFLAA